MNRLTRTIALTLIAGSFAAAGADAQKRVKKPPAPRQQKSQAELLLSYQEKVAQDWFAKAGWTDDFDVTIIQVWD